MADINQVITWGIGDPSGISFYILNGLGSGLAPPPVAASGGGAVPVRGWNGREYWDGQERGNVETIYRPSTTKLSPEPLRLTLKITGRLTSYNPTTPGDAVAPKLARDVSPVEAPAVRQKRVLPPLRPAVFALRFAISGELSNVPAHVTRISRSEAKIGARMDALEQRLEALMAENRSLYAELQQANDEIIDLEDQLLLGVTK